jgi:phospholipid-transporting ATPase
MSDNLDFTRLVSLNNPAAARQYQPAGSDYPPSASQQQPQLLDPFFDDDDEVPDSAFGRPPVPSRSVTNTLPSPPNTLHPAGSGQSKSNLPGEEIPEEWVFEDDPAQSTSDRPFPGSASFPGPFHVTDSTTVPRRRKWKWKWPWQRDKIILGDRVVALNNDAANDDFCSNFVSTSKYNVIDFFPKFLTGKYTLLISLFFTVSYVPPEQFSKYANIFFLFTACIQQIPDVSPTNQYTTIAPLILVLAASAFKEVQEDLVCAQQQ